MRGAINHRTPVTRLVAVLAAVAVVLSVGGCGSSAKPPAKAGAPSGAAGGVVVMPAGCSSSSSTSASGATSTSGGSCLFVLTDGRRFRCPNAAFGNSVPTVAELVLAFGCRPISRVRISAALRGAFAAIARSRACMVKAGLRVAGGPVPPQRPSSPDGELDVGNGNGGALIAFYPDPSTARRLEPSIVQRTKNLGAQVERRGAVTIVWVGAAASVRRAVRACVSP